ncbi:MAG: hypothetical protein AB8B59_02510 [Maribacter sp.]
MTFKFQPAILILAISLLIFSCEKEETNPEDPAATHSLAIKIVGNTDISGIGDLVVRNAKGYTDKHTSLQYGETSEIEANLTTEGNYVFMVEDANYGKIKMFASKDELLNATQENPFVLQFEHYKNETIATFQVSSDIGSGLRNRRINLMVIQSYGSLYHIDWGDGTEEIAEAPMESHNSGDPVDHKYSVSGDYTITLSTTKGEEVTGLDLQITGNGKGDRIQTLVVENIPNLTSLSLGDSDMKSVDSILEQYPNLTEFSSRFGDLTSIDFSNNPLLKLLIVNGSYNTQIKGLSGLTQLEFVGFTGDIEGLDLTLYPNLYHLGIKGHDMKTLNVSQNPKLTSLSLQLNGLEEIDLSSNVNLETLYINNNNLTALDLSKNTKIKHLNLYANYIDELDLSKQVELEYADLSSVHLKQVMAPESFDNITFLDLTNSRFLNEEALLDAVFKGQENNLKKNGKIIFNEYATVIERQVEVLNQMVSEHEWNINVPE